jgi:AP-1 complex subunit beta-1
VRAGAAAVLCNIVSTVAAWLQDAQEVVLAEKPTIKDTSLRLDPELRDALLQQLSTLASVYHKLPHTFVKRQRATVQVLSDLEAEGLHTGDEEGTSGTVCAAVDGVSGVSSSMLPQGGSPPLEGGSEPTAMDLLGGLHEERVRRC